MATNERLRGSLASAQLRTADVAERVGVDPKSVERWITKGRMPHRMHRVAVAKLLDADEAYIWPEILHAPATQSASVAELLAPGLAGSAKAGSATTSTVTAAATRAGGSDR